MKTIVNRLSYLLIVAFISYSCVNVKNKKEIKEFQLKVIVTDKIAQSDIKKLPAELDSLFLPLEPAGCEKIAFLPKVEIIRYGLSAEYHEVINTDGNSWKTFFQKFYGNTGVETQKTNIRKALGNYEVNDSLVLENSKNFIPSLTIENVLASNATSQFYIYKPAAIFATFKAGNKDIAVFANLKTLLTKIGNQLCEKPGIVNQNIIIFYNPNLETKADSVPIVKQDTIKNESKPVKPETKPQEKPVQNVKPNQGSLQGSETNPTAGRTITLPNGDKYVGEVKDGVPNGWGTVTFSVSRKISDDDPKKTVAEAGDHFTGVWINGKPQSGKLFDSKDNVKSTLIFGVAK